MSKGMVKFKAGGKSYALRLGWGAMRRFEKETGENVLPVIDGLQNPAAAPAFAEPLVVLFWAMLEPKQDTIDEAESIMDEIKPTELLELIGEAAALAFDDDGDPDNTPPTEEDGDEGNDKKT